MNETIREAKGGRLKGIISRVTGKRGHVHVFRLTVEEGWDAFDHAHRGWRHIFPTVNAHVMRILRRKGRS